MYTHNIYIDIYIKYVPLIILFGVTPKLQFSSTVFFALLIWSLFLVGSPMICCMEQHVQPVTAAQVSGTSQLVGYKPSYKQNKLG
jgi:hypothetical protein